MEKIKISEIQINKILQLEENHFYDLKAKDIAPGKLVKHLCAFANADGGEVYIGIDEEGDSKKRKWRGFDDIEAANAHLQVFNQIFPLGTGLQYTFLESEDHHGIVLHIIVNKSKDIRESADNRIFVRKGAQSLPLTNENQIRELKYNKGIFTFENELVNSDVRQIENSLVTIEFMLDVVPLSEPLVWLRKQQVVILDKPTVAGVVLFCDEPQALLPKRCAIKIYRYKTNERQGSRESLESDPITIEGCVYEQIKNSVMYTQNIIKDIPVLKDSGFEKLVYPPETLHEIITNAVLHRDYSITDDIHIRIFDNRVEVESPGTLAGHITPKNILEERFARNGVLVRLINKFPNPPNKDIGEGLNTAFTAMRKLKLKEPRITQREATVLVEIRHESLASAEEIIMKYLEDNITINNSKARSICFIDSENKMKRVFEKLMARSMIKRVPGLKGKSSAYMKM